MKYDYDSDGIIFNYFQIAIISLVLIPYTFSVLFGAKQQKTENLCECEPCLRKPKKVVASNWKRNLIMTAAWAYLSFVLYQAATRKLQETLWNPYQVLELDEGATVQQVKSAFRKLARQWHPDKVAKELHDEAEVKYGELTKAYKTLTNEDAREIWEEFGHPDGKQAMQLGIALPSWLVEKQNSFLVLGVYALIFGIALPMWVANWWGSSKNFTKDKIMHDTMGRFYKEMKDVMKIKTMIDLLTTAEEFRHEAEPSDPKELELLTEKVRAAVYQLTREKFEKSKLYGAIPWSFKVSVLLYAHLLRVPVKDPVLFRQQQMVVNKSAHLVQGMLQIAISRNWLNVTIMAIDLGQFIIQGFHYQQSTFSQLPYFERPEIAKALASRKKIANIRDLLGLEVEDLKELLKDLSLEEFKIMRSVALQYPLMKIVKAKFLVLGEPVIIPSAIVTLIVKLKLQSADELFESKRRNSQGLLENTIDPDEAEEPEKKWWINQDNQIVAAHAPYFPEERRPVWWVLLGDARGGRLITVTKVTLTASNEAIARLQFQAPPSDGKWTFQVFVKSDSFSGCDGRVDVDLIVDKLSAAPPADFEDEISEPEDGLIGVDYEKKDKGPKGEYDDSSDDDESPEATGGHDCSEPGHHH